MLCNQTAPPPPPLAPPAPAAVDCVIYVDLAGNDQNPGTAAGKAAKRTVAAGVAAARGGGLHPGPRTLCVGAGTFHLDATLEITAADAHLTILGDASGGTWLSGAK